MTKKQHPAPSGARCVVDGVNTSAGEAKIDLALGVFLYQADPDLAAVFRRHAADAIAHIKNHPSSHGLVPSSFHVELRESGWDATVE